MSSPIRRTLAEAELRPGAAPENFRFVDLGPETEDIEATVTAGLDRPDKRISCKFFYDERGSRLFERICELEEYYPTRTEIGILEANRDDIAARLGTGCYLVEFGSGTSAKVRILLDAANEPAAYTAVDISRDHLIASAMSVAERYPDLDVTALCADYTSPFEVPEPPRRPSARRVGFFPGSTIGNFTPPEAIAFLSASRRVLRGGGMLIGVDLQKDEAILNAAYNDREGVTDAFNLNALAHINDALGADFDLDGFAHEAFYNAADGRIELYLVSRRAQTVAIGERRFEFGEGEKIHTEYSHKFTIDGFRKIAAAAGFAPRAVWTDAGNLFSVHYLESPDESEV